MDQIIHLRLIPEGQIIEVTIPLKINLQIIKIEEQIGIECKRDDTIGCFLEQIKTGIKELILMKMAGTEEELELVDDDIEIYLKRTRQQGYKIIPTDITVSALMSQDVKKTRMVIFDKEYGVSVNSPEIKEFLLPPVLYATFLAHLQRFEGSYIDHEQCEFKWYRSKDKIEWEQVADEVHYTINSEDVGYFLKLTCKPFSDRKIEGPSVEAISQKVVLECPLIPSCPFELRHSHTKTKLSDDSFRVLSYNTLSRLYTHNDDKYSYCPVEFLSIDYRKQVILKELIGYNADIICLQEIDHEVYSNFLKPSFASQGYYTKFYRRAYYKREGLMCAVRKTRCKLLSYELLVFSQALRTKEIFSNFYNLVRGDRTFIRRFGMQSSSMLILTLKGKNKMIILVANIHLSHAEGNEDLKLVYSFLAIRYLNHMKEQLEEVADAFIFIISRYRFYEQVECILIGGINEEGRFLKREHHQLAAQFKTKFAIFPLTNHRFRHRNYKINIIMCGDFNSTPDSAVLEFLQNNGTRQEDYVLAGGCRLNLEHAMKLRSACGFPRYTCFTPDFKDCIDYIFIEEENAEVQRMIPFHEEELENCIGIPNSVYPSDHLALVADINFKN